MKKNSRGEEEKRRSSMEKTVMPLSKKKKVIKKRPLTKIRQKKTLKVRKKKNCIVGIITHYFPKVRAAVIKLKSPLAIGDVIKVTGHTTDFTQAVTSIQLDKVPINPAKKGQTIGLLVNSRVRQNDVVYKKTGER